LELIFVSEENFLFVSIENLGLIFFSRVKLIFFGFENQVKSILISKNQKKEKVVLKTLKSLIL
jgi:hypothetical protein